MHLIIFCGLRAMRNASSVYLHHLCLIFLAGMDTAFQRPSSMRLRGDTSFTAPRRGLCKTRRSTWCILPSRRRPSPHGTEGLPVVGKWYLLLLHRRIPSLRCTHPKAHTTHGHTSTTLEQEDP